MINSCSATFGYCFETHAERWVKLWSLEEWPKVNRSWISRPEDGLDPRELFTALWLQWKGGTNKGSNAKMLALPHSAEDCLQKIVQHVFSIWFAMIQYVSWIVITNVAEGEGMAANNPSLTWEGWLFPPLRMQRSPSRRICQKSACFPSLSWIYVDGG